MCRWFLNLDPKSKKGPVIKAETGITWKDRTGTGRDATLT
jgi:hypothetical protein